MLLLLGRPSHTLGRPTALLFPYLGLLGRPDPISFSQNIASLHSLSFSSHLVRLTLIPQTQIVQKIHPSHTKSSTIMPPKSRKGKEVATGSSSQPVSVVALVHPDCRDNFEKWQMKRKVVKQYIFNQHVAKNMHIPEVVSLIEHQNVHPLLECATPYYENTVRAFYAGFTREASCNFRFKMGSRSHIVDKRAWISIFGLNIVGDELRIEDGDVPGIYDHVAYMKSILKDPSVFDKPNETITAGHLKRDPRLLNW